MKENLLLLRSMISLRLIKNIYSFLNYYSVQTMTWIMELNVYIWL